MCEVIEQGYGQGKITYREHEWNYFFPEGDKSKSQHRRCDCGQLEFLDESGNWVEIQNES